MFDSYRAQVKWQTREERQKSLRSWLGGDCGCERCRAEKAGGEKVNAYWQKYVANLPVDGVKELKMMDKLSKMNGEGFLPAGLEI